MCSETDSTKKILFCATGSVATIKVPQIISSLKEELQTKVQIRFVPTAKALHFLPKLKDDAEKELDIKVFQDEDEWSSWQKRGDPVLHIELRKWADLLVIGNIEGKTL